MWCPNTVRLGIDISSLNISYRGGVYSFTLGLLKELQHASAGWKVILLVSGKQLGSLELLSSLSDCEVVVLKKNGGLLKVCDLVGMAFHNARIAYQLRGFVSRYISKDSRVIEANCDLIFCPTTVLNFLDLKIPSVVSMHDIQQVHYPQFFSKFELRWREIRFEATVRARPRFQASSRFIANDLVTNLPGLVPEQIEVIPEGVDTSEFVASMSVQQKLKQKLILFPAHMWEHKNHLVILRALNLLNREKIDCKLIICGGYGPATPGALEYIKENRLGNVEVLGSIPRSDLVEYFRKAAVVISPALYESSSLTVLEAVAANCQVVCSETGPNIEMSEFFDIDLCDPADPTAFAQAMRLALTRDLYSAETITEQNRRALGRYTWQSVAREYWRYFDQIIKEEFTAS